MSIRLRPNAKFHDGSPATGDEVANALNKSLPQFMGPAFEDITHIVAKAEYEIEIGFRRASPFLTEALELPILHPRDPALGTGPFRIFVQSSPNELRANDHYYLGRPALDRIVVTNYPSVRAACADLLRDGTDMLYEVSSDALDSLTGAKAISVFTFTRPYQYVIAFNLRSSRLQSPDVRRALNNASIVKRSSVTR